jgi:hypothetical protein
VEFSVNLTKLGLDPVTLLGGGNHCGMPFRRILVKTRSSASFTAELKDFVGPFDLFLPARVQIETATPYICDTGSVANIYVTNPVASYIYNWTTPNGHIVGSTTGPSINVDTPGVYIVHQFLVANCSEYAADTIQVYSFGTCNVLANNLYDFRAAINGTDANLTWKVLFNEIVDYFDIERSVDGINFTPIGRVNGTREPGAVTEYAFTDDLSIWTAPHVFYRLRMKETGTVSRYSPVIRLLLRQSTQDVQISPNPARDYIQMQVNATKNGDMKLILYNAEGKMVTTRDWSVQKGINVITLDNLLQYNRGMYSAVIYLGGEIYTRKLIFVH